MTHGLATFSTWLDTTAEKANWDLAAWREELNTFVRTRRLVEAIAHTVTSEEDINLLSARSFLHPTGAHKLVLATKGYERPELRLHIWPKGIDIDGLNNYESIHNHKWRFASHILSGAFQKRLYSPSDHGEIFRRFVFRSPVRGQVYKSDYVDNTRLEETFNCFLSPGDSYYQSNEQLHMFHPVMTIFSATLFIRFAYQSDETTVCMPLGKDAIMDSGVLVRFNNDQVSNLLRGVINNHG